MCRCSLQPETLICPTCGKAVATGGWETGVLVLLPLMLGVNKVETRYYSLIKLLLKMNDSVGIIGGMTRSALYFVGFQNDSLIYLDPHIVKIALKSNDELYSSLDSFVSDKARLLPLSKVKASMSVGFYFNSQEAFNRFQRGVEGTRSILQGIISVVNRSPDSFFDGGSSLGFSQIDDSGDEFICFD